MEDFKVSWAHLQYGDDLSQVSPNKKSRSRHHRKFTSQFDDGNRTRKKSCKLCSKQMENDEDLAKHVELEHANRILELNYQKNYREFLISCKYCDQHFDFQNLYYEHARKAHKDIISKEWLPCETCSMYFSSQTDLILHNNVSHSERALSQCSFCVEKFPNESEYHKHVNSKHKDLASWHNWKPCERCTCLYPSTKDLSRHRVQKHFHEIVKTRRCPPKPKPQTRHALWKTATSCKVEDNSKAAKDSLISDHVETNGEFEEYVYIVMDESIQTQQPNSDIEGRGKEITSMQVDDNIITFQIQG